MSDVNMTWEQLVDYVLKVGGKHQKAHMIKFEYLEINAGTMFCADGKVVCGDIYYNRSYYQMYQIIKALTEKGGSNE